MVGQVGTEHHLHRGREAYPAAEVNYKGPRVAGAIFISRTNDEKKLREDLENIQRGYLVTRKRNGQNSWWRYCEQTKRPYVVVVAGRKYSEISIDMVWTGCYLRATAVQKIRKLLLKQPGLEATVPQEYLDGRVLTSEAETIARRIVELASDPKNQLRKGLPSPQDLEERK